MQRPLQITFKGMESSPAFETLIRRRVDRLERLYPRMTGCRVVVEVPHRASESGKVPIAVSVEADLPRTKSSAAVLGAVRAGLNGGWQAALDVERRELVRLRSTPEGKAAIQAFFEKSAAKK